MTPTQARARIRTAWGWVLSRARARAVEVGRPGVGVPAVRGEVDERVAQLLVAGEAERHRAVLPRLAGRRGGPGEAGQRLGRREALPAVADLGQQGRRPDTARARQAREDVTVGVDLRAAQRSVASSATIWSRTAARQRRRRASRRPSPRRSRPVSPGGAASSRAWSSAPRAPARSSPARASQCVDAAAG